MEQSQVLLELQCGVTDDHLSLGKVFIRTEKII